jgi:hypothetical protein
MLYKSRLAETDTNYVLIYSFIRCPVAHIAAIGSRKQLVPNRLELAPTL